MFMLVSTSLSVQYVEVEDTCHSIHKFLYKAFQMFLLVTHISMTPLTSTKRKNKLS